MVFYVGKLVLSKELNNPTIVVITDRNDLDDQLFSTCQIKRFIAPGTGQAQDRADLQGSDKGIGRHYLTTIHNLLRRKGDRYLF